MVNGEEEYRTGHLPNEGSGACLGVREAFLKLMRNFNDYFMRKLVFAGLLLAFLVSGGWLARGEVVMVGWNGSADAGVIGYRIAYGKVSGKYDVQVEVGNQLEGLLVGLEEGERYYVVVVIHGFSL